MTGELLTGDNKYEYEGRRVEALKGLRIARLPYLLSLQLRRFDLDWHTLRRVKVNDALSFPQRWDLAEFVAWRQEGLRRALEREQGGAEATSPPPDAPTDTEPIEYELYAVLVHTGTAMGGHYFAYIKVRAPPCALPPSLSPCALPSSLPLSLCLPGSSPHSSSSHRLLLQQDWASGRWLNFNDTAVTSLSEDELAAVFGNQPAPEAGSGDTTSGGPRPAKPLARSATNAYMLLYRRVDAERNVTSVPDDAVPAELRAEVEEDNAVFRRERAEWERQRQLLHLRVFRGPGLPTAVTLNENQTVEEAEGAVYAELGLEGEGVPRDCMRLRQFDRIKVRAQGRGGVRDHGGLADRLTSTLPPQRLRRAPLAASPDTARTTTLKDLGLSSHRPLTVETREPGEVGATRPSRPAPVPLTRPPFTQEFEPWYENGMQLRLIRAVPPATDDGGADPALPELPEDPRDIAALCTCEEAVELAVPRDGTVETLRACAARKVRPMPVLPCPPFSDSRTLSFCGRGAAQDGGGPRPARPAEAGPR